MSQTRKFKTKNGYCHIMQDRIVFTHSGLFGHLGDILGEGKMSRILILFGVFTFLSLSISYVNWEKGDIVWAWLFLIISGYLVYAIFRNIRTTLHPIIDRESISEVTYFASKDFFTLPHFEIRFKDEKGNVIKRIVNLPRNTPGNKKEINHALILMREEGLIHPE